MEEWLSKLVAKITRTKPDDDVRNLIRWLSLTVIGLFVVGVGLLILDVVGHIRAWPLGTFGDFFGGVLNPILAFCTVAGLAATIIMQRAGFSAARVQAFETTFFNMLDLHHNIVQDLRFDPSIITSNTNLTSLLKGALPVPQAGEITGRQVFSLVLKSLELFKADERPRVYKELQVNHNDVLGHYFRNLYQILKLIHKFARELEDPKVYSGIVRSQLSTFELQLLFYNCLKGMVDHGRFQELVKTYHLLEHMPLTFDPLTTPYLLCGQYLPENMSFIEEFFAEQSVSVNGRKLFNAGAYGSNQEVFRYLVATKRSQI